MISLDPGLPLGWEGITDPCFTKYSLRVCSSVLHTIARCPPGCMASCTNDIVWVERALPTLVSHHIHYEYVRVCCILTPDVLLVVWRAAQIILSASSHSCTSDLASLAVGASTQAAADCSIPAICVQICYGALS